MFLEDLFEFIVSKNVLEIKFKLSSETNSTKVVCQIYIIEIQKRIFHKNLFKKYNEYIFSNLSNQV